MFAKCHGVPAHLLIVGGVIAAITPVRLALTERYAEERHRIEAQGRNQRTRELVAKWNALRYTDITDEHFADDIVAAIHWASLNLSEVQKVKLEQRLRDVFGYLQNPTFEEYYRLKTEGLHYQLEPGKITSARLRKVALMADRAGKLEPREILESLWDASMIPTAQAPARITGVCLAIPIESYSQADRSDVRLRWNLQADVSGPGHYGPGGCGCPLRIIERDRSRRNHD